MSNTNSVSQEILQIQTFSVTTREHYKDMNREKVMNVTVSQYEPVTTGERIRKYRKKEDVSQERLAEEINCSRATLNRWETGKYNVPDDIIETLSLRWGIQPAYLRTETEYPTYEEEEKVREDNELADLIGKIKAHNEHDLKIYRLAISLLNMAGVKIEPRYGSWDELIKEDKFAEINPMINEIFTTSKYDRLVKVLGVYVNNEYLHVSEFHNLACQIVDNAVYMSRNMVQITNNTLKWRGYYADNSDGQQAKREKK